ncbi:MAG TPA: glycosyltransferase [Candidatus Nanoarchaeia archaeon]|nr:glycosyltransferase [Candidatus Nanoarchaeia archaeon]
MKKTKLLLVSDTFLPKVDGTVRFIEEFIKRARDHFDLSLLIPQFEQPLSVKGIKTVLLEVSKIIHPLPTYPAIKISLFNLLKIKDAVKESEIVFAQGPAFASYIAVLFAYLYQKPVYFYTHVLPWELLEQSTRSHWGKFWAYWVRRGSIFIFNRCNKILVPYHDLGNQLRDFGLKTNLSVARLGIDIERFSPSKNKIASKKKVSLDEKKLVVGYVGRISKEKNIENLLEAFKKIRYPQRFTLLLVGDGSEELVNKFKKAKNCQVTGFVENVEDYLKAMDVFVMPSLTETTSLATLEAMSCGLPVIATKVGFIEHYLTKDQNGLFFPRNSSTLLAIKIEKLLKEPKLREQLGQNARKTVAYSFSWERSINKIRRILDE